jgi:hypothetical protein
MTIRQAAIIRMIAEWARIPVDGVRRIHSQVEGLR